jgi:hypothetical protein
MQEIQGDTRFVPKVRSITKVANISIGVLTKSRVSFNPNPPKLPLRPTRCSLSILMKRRAIQISRDSTTILESSRATPSHLGDWIPRVTNTTRSSRESVCCSCLNWWLTQGSSNLLSRTRIKSLILGREGEAQALDLKGARWVSQWPSDSKESFREFSLVDLFRSRSQTGQVWSTGLGPWHHRTSPVGASGSQPWIGLVQPTKQVRCRDWKSPVPTSRSRWELLSYPIFIPKPSTHRMHDPGLIVPHIRPRSVHR